MAERDPHRTHGLFVDPLMPASQQGPAYAGIARRPQALWLSNEYYPRDQVADVVCAYTSRAAEAGRTVVRPAGRPAAGPLRPGPRLLRLTGPRRPGFF